MADLKIYQQERTVKSKSHKKDYVDWVKKVFAELNEPLPCIKDGRGTRTARGGKNILNLPRWSRTEIVMLHEIAHVIQKRHTGKTAHNREFKEITLKLVSWFISDKKMQQLKRAYNKR